MPSEQAEGCKLDGRSDIFSFGAVLYEMLTGRRAFHGESKASTMAAVLREEPRIPEGMPHEVERVVTRCLRKDPARRFQHMDDLKVALEDLKEETESAQHAPIPPPASRRRAIPLLALLGVLVAVGGGWWVTHNRRTDSGQGTVMRRLTTDPGLSTEPALSPDGKLVVYASDRAGDAGLDLWVQQLAGGEPVRLTRDPTDDREPSFSPDGSQITFSSEREGGGVYVISTLGGVERKIADRGRGPRFSPDGQWIAYWVGERASILTEGQVFVVASTGGAPRRIQPTYELARYPVWSPDGKHLLFEGSPPGSGFQLYDWWVTPLDGGKALQTGAMEALRAQKLAPEISGATFWTNLIPPSQWASGQIVFAALQGDTRNIWQVPVSSSSFRITNGARRLTSGTGLEGNPALAVGSKVVYRIEENKMVNVYLVPSAGGLAQKAVDGCFLNDASDTGRLLCWVARRLELVELSSGRRTPILKGRLGGAYRLSWDKRWVTFYVMNPTGQSRVFISPVGESRPTEESEWIPITDGNAWDALPQFSPDGKLLYFMSQRDGFRCMMAQRLDPTSKRPVGPAWTVQHFHSARLSPIYIRHGQMALEVARDKIVITMEERLGNIWLAEN